MKALAMKAMKIGGSVLVALVVGCSVTTPPGCETPTEPTVRPVVSAARAREEAADHVLDDPIDDGPVEEHTPASRVHAQLKPWSLEPPVPPPGVPRVNFPRRVGETSGVDGMIVQRVIRKAMPAFRRCRSRALRASPKLEAASVVSFDIQPDGSVANVKMGSEQGALSNCLRRVLLRLTFPKPRLPGTVTRISYGLNSDPQ